MVLVSRTSSDMTSAINNDTDAAHPRPDAPAWYAAYPTPRAAVPSITISELHDLMHRRHTDAEAHESWDAQHDFLVVDVRRADIEVNQSWSGLGWDSSLYRFG